MGNPAERRTGHAIAECGIETVLERYFEQLMRWGMILTRGDVDVAEEIVQDLCVYLALSSPDLSAVANQDGYLYTSLRNMYVSRQARAARERMRVMSIADFDSVEAVLASRPAEDLLDRQNQILQICSYLNWRKETSKSASYLVLLFFHGYERSEVARIALVPVATIYNKLRSVRAEIKDHLDALRKLRLIARSGPPQARLLSSPMSSAAFFMELRAMIFHSESSGCPAEQALLDLYRAAPSKPIPCAVLAHIVSCERCLSIVDRHSQFPPGDERGPFGGVDSRGGGNLEPRGARYQPMLRAVRRRLEQIQEHRPGFIALAVNGKVTKFFEIRGERSLLSARVEDTAALQFIEVFSDHQHRLAQLSTEGLGPEGRGQRIALSDDRWLELRLQRDGRAIEAEAVYCDPSLASAADTMPSPAALHAIAGLAEVESSGRRRSGHRATGVLQSLRDLRDLREWIAGLLSAPALAGSVVLLAILAVGGYAVHRSMRSSLPAAKILSRAVAVESIQPAGETEHQVVAIEELTASGTRVPQGRIELWRQGGGRHMVRRIFDAGDRLLASEYQNQGATPVTVASEHEKTASAMDQALIGSGLWQREISARAFQQAARRAQAIRTAEGYEVRSSAVDFGEPQVVSATLVLDRGFHLREERLAFAHNGITSRLRFVQTEYRMVPDGSVPDSVFEPPQPASPGALSNAPAVPRSSLRSAFEDAGRVEIDVLYQLSRMGADTSDPIAVATSSDGHVRITGTVSGKERLAQVEARLRSLEDRSRIEDDLTSSTATPRGRPHKAGSSAVIDVYPTSLSDPPALEILQQHFRASGMTDEAARAAAFQVSAGALQNAEEALENAYALDRLGSILSSILGSIPTRADRPLDASSQREWVQMVSQHAADLQTHLLALRSQLGLLEPAALADAKDEPAQDLIHNAAEFARSTAKLRENMQTVNTDVGALFTNGTSRDLTDPKPRIANALHSLPVRSAAGLKQFAEHLSSVQGTAAEPSAPESRP